MRYSELKSIIINLRVLVQLKKQSFADAFSQVASKLTLTVTPYKSCELLKLINDSGVFESVE